MTEYEIVLRLVAGRGWLTILMWEEQEVWRAWDFSTTPEEAAKKGIAFMAQHKEAVKKLKEPCVWHYHDSHGGWTTSCGASYDADDFEGCEEIKTCPNCQRTAIMA